MIKRNRYIFENVIEVEEYHDGNYGAPGKKREKKKKPTKEQMERVNLWNKTKKTRHQLRRYFHIGKDWFLTLTFRKESRPANMKEAQKLFGKFIRKIRTEFKKRDKTLYWISNIENTDRNNWHIHLVISDLEGTNIITLMNKAWPHGRVKDPQMLYEKGELGNLASYITKNEKSKKGLVYMDHTVTEAKGSHSRNMPLPPPDVKKLMRWRQEPKAKEGFYIDPNTLFEGINPVTGYKYRHYTMIRIVRRE